jgi:hypothetical protein
MVFRHIAHKLGNTKSSELIFLGAPEAEAEALPNSRMPLFQIYGDHHGLAADVKAPAKAHLPSMFRYWPKMSQISSANLFGKVNLT